MWNLGAHEQDAPGITIPSTATNHVTSSALLFQETLKDQIMMWYGNIRRKSSGAKEKKLNGFKLPPVVAK